MIQSKFPPAAAREDDVQSVVSEAASVSSWTQVPQGQGHGQSSTESPDPWAETGEQTDSDGLKMPPADLKLGSIPEHGTADQAGRSHAAPVTQAAQNWVDHANETPAQRRLRKEQEKAARKGYRRVQWKQMGAHNAVNVALPKHIQQVGSGEGERSVLVLDARDLRMQSPYQGWLLDEIITNAYAGINVLSDRQLVRAPSSGYHLNIFMLKTLVGHKLVLCGSMTSYGGVPCGAWDAPTGSVLSHQAFQPFRWPLMSEESPTWVDVKVKLGGHLLVHLELRGYRSDQDMSVQLHHVAEALLWLLQEEIFVPTFVVTIFQGYRACLGPFFSESEVTEVVQHQDWVPTQRFEVVQKNKVRGCDSATTNLVNRATVITEKLQLPSTDSNVAALRCLRSRSPLAKLAGWVLDEKKAYRQVAIDPAHRKFSVICLKDPESTRVGFFVMVGHSFGLVSAVYNYNRRSAAINEFLVKIFGVVAFSFYDDKYGFETMESVASAHQCAQHVHWWLGAAFDPKKLQLTRSPTVLGVTYNLVDMVLEIKAERKTELIGEMEAIVENDLLDPGSAGKLKGKLMFGASQLWGKVGRAFLRVISERQYARHPPDGSFSLGIPLKKALEQWMFLVKEGPPRSIDLSVPKFSEVVFFTDGFSPDPRFSEKKPDRIGAVMIDRRLTCPVQFTAVVPQKVKAQWLDRKTQIVPVEMLAPIIALSTFESRLVGCDVLLFVDSEAVEAALVKGYSSKSDLCDLIKIFWDLVFKLRIRVFIDRVATDANPADWPSRNDLETGSKAGWRSVRPIWPDALC